MGIFDKYIDDGIGKAQSFHRKLNKVRDIIIDLSESLQKFDVELNWFDIGSTEGIGYQTVITTNGFHKNFISVTIAPNEDEVYFLEYNKSITISKSIDSLISNIGKVISSSSFWREIDQFRST